MATKMSMPAMRSTALLVPLQAGPAIVHGTWTVDELKAQLGASGSLDVGRVFHVLDAEGRRIPAKPNMRIVIRADGDDLGLPWNPHTMGLVGRAVRGPALVLDWSTVEDG